MIILALLFSTLFNAGSTLEISSFSSSSVYFQPEQIHIAYGDKVNDIVVTWSTFNATTDSVVQYGVDAMTQEARGTQDVFTDGGIQKRQQWIHRVTLIDLQHDTMYKYHCGSDLGWSETFAFKTPPSSGKQKPIRAVIFGDMGVTNARTLPYLKNETESYNFDFAIHVGDFAYDLQDDNARLGDQFMQQIQPIGAILPYMTCPGNHENAYNFSNYKNRFTMPSYQLYESMFYTWDIGPIHFISINTEAYYYPTYAPNMLSIQFDWLRNDLISATKEENRKVRPWIIIYGHRPMYCSDLGDIISCAFERTRIGYEGKYAVEPLLKEFGVDMVIWAHEHVYERLWPVYNKKVYNGSHNEPYNNPGAPVHIITGSAGCKEYPDPFVVNPAHWSAFRSRDYGFTRLTAYNDTHLYMDQVSVVQHGKVIDSFWLIKDAHEAFNDI